MLNSLQKCAELESNLTELDSNIKHIGNKTAVIESILAPKWEQLEKCQATIDYLFKENIMRESYNKRLNILVHGIDENSDGNFETKTETKKIFDEFLKEALNINPKSIGVVDLHRLPQHRVTRHGRKVTRPIIIKLQSAL